MNLVMIEPWAINGVKNWFNCIERFEEKSNDSIPWRYGYHDYIEVLYALDADGYAWINGEKMRYDTGTLIVINPKEPHALTFNSTSHHFCIRFSPHILYSDEKSFYEFKYIAPFLLDDTHRYVFKREDISAVDVQSLIVEIMEEWEKKENAYELVIRSNILKIFSGIFRYWNENKVFHSHYEMSDTMKAALAYVSENFVTLTQKEVANHCNVSYQYLSRMFKNTMGKGFNEYITFLRLREAEKMLLSSDKDVTEIAFACGFSSPSYFIERFKKAKGITPKQFRDKTRESDISPK